MENREIAKSGVSPENLELLKIALKTAELAEENELLVSLVKKWVG